VAPRVRIRSSNCKGHAFTNGSGSGDAIKVRPAISLDSRVKPDCHCGTTACRAWPLALYLTGMAPLLCCPHGGEFLRWMTELWQVLAPLLYGGVLGGLTGSIIYLRRLRGRKPRRWVLTFLQFAAGVEEPESLQHGRTQ